MGACFRTNQSAWAPKLTAGQRCERDSNYFGARESGIIFGVVRRRKKRSTKYQCVFFLFFTGTRMFLFTCWWFAMSSGALCLGARTSTRHWGPQATPPWSRQKRRIHRRESDYHRLCRACWEGVNRHDHIHRENVCGGAECVGLIKSLMPARTQLRAHAAGIVFGSVCMFLIQEPRGVFLWLRLQPAEALRHFKAIIRPNGARLRHDQCFCLLCLRLMNGDSCW